MEKSWFERHPRLTLAVIVVTAVVGLDMLAAAIAPSQPEDLFRRPDPRFHHGLYPNRSTTTWWGKATYPMITNSLGMRDGSEAEVPLRGSRPRALIFGDSFAEGVGLPFEQTFAGLAGATMDTAGMDVLNAGVVSYSPRLYLLKLRYLLEDVGLQISHAVVFVDISDIQDEIFYERFVPKEESLLVDLAYRAGRLLRRRSLFCRTAAGLLADKPEGPADSTFGSQNHVWFDALRVTLGEEPNAPWRNPAFLAERALWTTHREVFERWGRRGLELASRNMDAFVSSAKAAGVKVAVAVYPWPHQVEHAQRDCLQRSFWKSFAEHHGVGFIDLFEPFFDNPDTGTLFIEGDNHWNEAGHRVVAERLTAWLKNAR